MMWPALRSWSALGVLGVRKIPDTPYDILELLIAEDMAWARRRSSAAPQLQRLDPQLQFLELLIIEQAPFAPIRGVVGPRGM